MGRDSTLAGAESFLLVHPDRHVAVVLETNCDDLDEIREFDRSNRHRLALTDASGESWHLALAIPRLDAWALTDDHIRREFAEIRQDPDSAAATYHDREKIERANYLNLAAQMKSPCPSPSFRPGKPQAKEPSVSRTLRVHRAELPARDRARYGSRVVLNFPPSSSLTANSRSHPFQEQSVFPKMMDSSLLLRALPGDTRERIQNSGRTGAWPVDRPHHCSAT